MAQQPKTITNPRTGQRMTFISQSQDELRIDSVNPPTDVPAPLRLHLRQETGCEVLSGTLLFEVGGERTTVTAGQSITVPAGTPYCFHIEGSEDAHSIQSWRPALNTAEFFETYFELARRDELDNGGIPKPLALATMLTEFGDTVRPVNPPWLVLRLLATVLGPIARARGYNAGLRASAPSTEVAHARPVPSSKRHATRIGNRIGVWMYRASNGRLGSASKRVQVLVITTPGRRTGVPRSTCVRYLDTPSGLLVWGTGSGSRRDPDWFWNLRATTEADVLIRSKRLHVRIRELTGDERDAAWTGTVLAEAPEVAKYARPAGRKIPVALLTDVDGPPA